MKQISNHAAAAKAIRQYLKSVGIKASVRARSYAGGSSVDVEVNDLDPVTFETVKAFANQYQYGHFDGMTDCYEYSNSNDDRPQVKFVFVNNIQSAELSQKGWDFVRDFAGADELPASYEDLDYNHNVLDQEAKQIVYQLLSGGYCYKDASERFWKANAS